MNRKVHAPKRVRASGEPHIVTWIKQTWIKHQCTDSVGTISNGEESDVKFRINFPILNGLPMEYESSPRE